MIVVGSTFYERREVRDVLAYMRVLTDPDDDASVRRIVNVPKRGIGPTTASRLAEWAQANQVSLAEAIDRADEAGLRGPSLEGALRLSAAVGRIAAPGADDANRADLVEIVADRTGYRTALTAEHTPQADDRLENLTMLATRARQYKDLAGFLQAVALEAASDKVGPMATSDSRPAPSSSSNGPATASPTAPRRRARRSRTQMLLGCVGIALFAVGATIATVAALKE